MSRQLKQEKFRNWILTKNTCGLWHRPTQKWFCDAMGTHNENCKHFKTFWTVGVFRTMAGLYVHEILFNCKSKSEAKTWVNKQRKT